MQTANRGEHGKGQCCACNRYLLLNLIWCQLITCYNCSLHHSVCCISVKERKRLNSVSRRFIISTSTAASWRRRSARGYAPGTWLSSTGWRTMSTGGSLSGRVQSGQFGYFCRSSIHRRIIFIAYTVINFCLQTFECSVIMPQLLSKGDQWYLYNWNLAL